MRVPLDLTRIEEEVELPPDVVGIVKNQRVLLDEGALIAESGQLEDSRVQIPPLLSPNGLEVEPA